MSWLLPFFARQRLPASFCSPRGFWPRRACVARKRARAHRTARWLLAAGGRCRVVKFGEAVARGARRAGATAWSSQDRDHGRGTVKDVEVEPEGNGFDSRGRCGQAVVCVRRRERRRHAGAIRSIRVRDAEAERSPRPTRRAAARLAGAVLLSRTIMPGRRASDRATPDAATPKRPARDDGTFATMVPRTVSVRIERKAASPASSKRAGRRQGATARTGCRTPRSDAFGAARASLRAREVTRRPSPKSR